MKFKYVLSILLLFFTLIMSCNTPMNKEFLYIGTFSEKGQDGIYVFEFNRDKVSVEPIQSEGGMESPSYLTIHPNGKYMYSVNRNTVSENQQWGSVSAFSIDKSKGNILHLNDQPAQGGESCYIILDSKGRFAFIANYNTGNVVMYPVLPDGSLGDPSDMKQHTGYSINSDRQEGPHAHCVMVSPDDKYLYAVDLGIDKIKVYEIDYENKKLIDIPSADRLSDPGAGPRHIDFHPRLNMAYVIEELSSHISAYKIDPISGAMQLSQKIKTIPDEYTDTNYCADIHVHPNGKYLYGSNRGNDSLAIYGIDQADGSLFLIGFQSVFGKWPRNFLIDPKGEFLFVVNQNSNNLVIFEIDTNTGLLTRKGPDVSIPKPVCVKILSN